MKAPESKKITLLKKLGFFIYFSIVVFLTSYSSVVIILEHSGKYLPWVLWIPYVVPVVLLTEIFSLNSTVIVIIFGLFIYYSFLFLPILMFFLTNRKVIKIITMVFQVILLVVHCVIGIAIISGLG